MMIIMPMLQMSKLRPREIVMTREQFYRNDRGVVAFQGWLPYRMCLFS